MRLGNDALVVNMTTLLKDQNLKRLLPMSMLSEAYLNLEEKDSALIRLKVAEKFTNKTEKKARYIILLSTLRRVR
jgi:hypothetical protein